MNAQTLEKVKRLASEIFYLISENEETPEKPANVTPIRDDEVELEGVIGRPELKEVKGKTLFTAGLGVKEGNVTQWHALEVWGSTALDASTLIKGQVVKVVGKSQEVNYVGSDGVMRSKLRLIASSITPAEHIVGSA